MAFPTVEQAVDYYFEYYRKHGYPNYKFSQYDPRKELERVESASGIISDGVAKQTMQGCGFLWCFFPHWVEVRTISDTSLSENWEDDEKLRSMLEKTVKWCIKHENCRMSVNRIRQLAKVYLCKQSPSNFRPTVAKAIYDLYGNNGSVYDPCAGWGGEDARIPRKRL